MVGKNTLLRQLLILARPRTSPFPSCSGAGVLLIAARLGDIRTMT